MYNVCTYIPKNDQDGNPRDNFPEGGGEGERQGVVLLIMLVKTLSLFWESNNKTDFIEVRRGGVLTKFF